MSETDWSARFDAKEWARGHEALCTERARNVNGKLNLIMGILGAIGAAVVTFAGYTYAENQKMEHDQLVAAQQALVSIHQSADEASTKTAIKLGATNGAATPTD